MVQLGVHISFPLASLIHCTVSVPIEPPLYALHHISMSLSTYFRWHIASAGELQTAQCTLLSPYLHTHCSVPKLTLYPLHHIHQTLLGNVHADIHARLVSCKAPLWQVATLAAGQLQHSQIAAVCQFNFEFGSNGASTLGY